MTWGANEGQVEQLGETFFRPASPGVGPDCWIWPARQPETIQVSICGNGLSLKRELPASAAGKLIDVVLAAAEGGAP